MQVDLDRAVADGDHLAHEMLRAGAEIHDLQQANRIRDRDLATARSESDLAIASYDSVSVALTAIPPSSASGRTLGSESRREQAVHDKTLADIARSRTSYLRARSSAGRGQTDGFRTRSSSRGL
ncbi:hypothetical protein V7S43_012303 [Phytophthora oleae]|uniref:Uncharacterized protein n=1 Tax=Phytophthora oleae TaxID=2107226 RepID=A0ABD3F6F7_9STRA